MMRIVRAADCRVMPWKNGGGTTTEIAVHPVGAGLDDFLWRVSMAHVASDGPFSAFAGIDRTLSILSGEGIRLAVAGRPAVELTPQTLPFAFPGDAQAAAALIAGPVDDLNVMTRRGKLAHRVERVTGSIEVKAAGTALAFCSRGSCAITGYAGQADLAAGDTAIAGDEKLRLTPSGGTELYLIEIFPA